MKYQQTDRWFRLPDGKIVRPFNAEEVFDRRNVSWSHGFTHLQGEEGQISFCGQQWFEENAEAIE